jgi:hypothetical protein
LKRGAFIGSSAAALAATFLRDVSFAAETDATGLELTSLVETLLPFGALARQVVDFRSKGVADRSVGIASPMGLAVDLPTEWRAASPETRAFSSPAAAA